MCMYFSMTHILCVYQYCLCTPCSLTLCYNPALCQGATFQQSPFLLLSHHHLSFGLYLSLLPCLSCFPCFSLALVSATSADCHIVCVGLLACLLVYESKVSHMPEEMKRASVAKCFNQFLDRAVSMLWQKACSCQLNLLHVADICITKELLFWTLFVCVCLYLCFTSFICIVSYLSFTSTIWVSPVRCRWLRTGNARLLLPMTAMICNNSVSRRNVE